MFHYYCECPDERALREELWRRKARDLPTGRGFWGNPMYQWGLHFTNIGERVTGFCLRKTEDEGFRVAEPRVCFRGRFRETAEGTQFELWLYPRWFELLILLLFGAFSFLTRDAVVLAVFLLILPFALWNYVKLMQYALSELRSLFQ